MGDLGKIGGNPACRVPSLLRLLRPWPHLLGLYIGRHLNRGLQHTHGGVPCRQLGKSGLVLLLNLAFAKVPKRSFIEEFCLKTLLGCS